MTTTVPVFHNKYAPGWPDHPIVSARELARYVPIASALTDAHDSDAHVACYSTPEIDRRLAGGNVFAELTAVPMVMFLIDVEPEGHAEVTIEWWGAEREKIHRLFADHPGGFVYRTRGGYRVVYKIAPVVLGCAADAAAWKARYLAWLDVVEATYGIIGDRSCQDWTRLYRLPRVVRDGKPQDLETIGDASEIGLWSVEVVIPEPTPAEPRRPVGSYTPKPGDFDIFEFMASHYPGAERHNTPTAQRWDIDCPWKHEHSDDGGSTRQTAVFAYPSGAWEFKCLRNHCAGRNHDDFRRWHQPEWAPFEERPRQERQSPPPPGAPRDAPPPPGAPPPTDDFERDPEPLRRKVAPPWPYPIEALGSVLGAAAMRLHEIVQAPLALCGQSLLAAASLAAQPHADVLIDGRRIPLTLWAITVAESGERKSAIDSIALSAHVEREREQLEVAEVDQRSYEAKQAAYEAAVARAKRAKGGVSDIELAIRTCGPAPLPPTSGFLIVREPTIEAVQKIYLSGAPSLGLFTDEGATFFGGHSMSKEHVMRSAGALSKLWDDGSSDRVRAGDGASKIYGRRLALHLLMQPVVAERVLSDEMLSGQGFLARALVTWPETTAGTRNYRAINPTTTLELQRYHALMGNLLTFPPKLRQGRRGELDTRALTLTDAAKRTWVEACDAIEKQMKPGNPYSTIRPWASKGAEQVLRIAGVLTLLENHQAEKIEVATIVAASKLVAFYLNEAMRLASTANDPPEIKNAETILEWCCKRKMPVVDSRTLLRMGPNCVRNGDVLDGAMDVLVKRGWACSITTNGPKKAGPAHRAWSIRIDAQLAAS